MEFLLPILVLLGLGFLFTDDGETSSQSGTAGEGDEGEAPEQPVTPQNNILNFDDDANVALGSDGNDVVRALAGDDVILAGDGDDNVFAGDGDDTVAGEEGNDRIFLGRGNDVSTNGDVFTDLAVQPSGQTASGDDLIRGGAGADQIIDILGSNTLYGDTGSDILSGRDAEFDQGTPDTLFGGFGDDVLRANDGDDLTGGAGDDVFDIAASGSAGPAIINDFEDGENLIIRLPDGTPAPMERVSSAVSDNGEDLNILLDEDVVAVLKGLTALPEGTFTMTAGGTAGASGSSGGSDSYENALFGTENADTIVADDGQDAVFTGAGDDIITQTTTGATDPSDQALRINAGIGNDSVVAGGGDDVIFGNLGADTIDGNEGNDTIFGGFGSDLIATDDQSTDTPDVVDGGGNNDVLIGDNGDTFTGGDGRDSFANVLRDVTSDPITITDFDPANEQLEVQYEANELAIPPAFNKVASADGADTVISFGTTEVFVLRGVAVADVALADIILTPAEL
jgi:Ca2+-binding RTX toxin-like protein